MYIQQSKKKSDGTIIYAFKYRDKQGKQKSVPRSEWAHIKSTDKKAMEEFLPILEAKYDARKKEIQKRESWHDRYYNFVDLRKEFVNFRKRSTPKNWKTKLSWFDNYVLHYFLNIKKEPSLDAWSHSFGSFRDWLERHAKGVKTKKPLAYQSKNHCITELNKFMEHMAFLRKCDQAPRCPQFESKLVDNEKGAESVISDDEMKELCLYLKKKHGAVYADLCKFLRHTGMRINEALGISLEDVKKGVPPNKPLQGLLAIYKLKPIAYIVLEKQPLGRDDEGKMSYSPLKSKNKISLSNARYIPITSKEVYNILVKYIKTQSELLKKNVYGKEKVNYPLFYDLVTDTILNDRMKDAYTSHKPLKGLKRKTPHDFRHTKATEYGGLDFTGQLQKLVLGHGEKTAKRYNHIFEQMMEASANQETDLDEFEFI